MRAERDQAEKQQARKNREVARSPLSPEAHEYLRALSNDPKVSPEELAGISKLLRESPEVAKVAITKGLQSIQARTASHLANKIKEGRMAFTEKAKDYVELHLKATRAAYAAGEFDTAARHAEWAMEKLGTKNLRLIELPDAKDSGGGPRIMVGVKIGGQQPVAIDGHPDTD
jgi:hypothetical protein